MYKNFFKLQQRYQNTLSKRVWTYVPRSSNNSLLDFEHVAKVYLASRENLWS